MWFHWVLWLHLVLALTGSSESHNVSQNGPDTGPNSSFISSVSSIQSEKVGSSGVKEKVSEFGSAQKGAAFSTQTVDSHSGRDGPAAKNYTLNGQSLPARQSNILQDTGSRIRIAREVARLSSKVTSTPPLAALHHSRPPRAAAADQTPGLFPASSPTNCHCITQLLMDFMTVHEWSAITIILSEDNKLLTKACLQGVSAGQGGGLLQRAWGRRGRVIVQRAANAVPLLERARKSVHQNFLMENSNASRSVLKKASDMGLLDFSSWVVLMAPESFAPFTAFAASLEAYIPSELYPITFEHCEAELWSLYRVGPRVAEVHREHGGMWNLEDGFLGHAHTLNKLDRRADFRGYPMKGTGVNVFDFFTTYLPNGGVSGFVGDLVTTLKKTHNFTLTYGILKGYAYGKIVGANNNWDGMVGELQNRRVDLTVSELSITQERAAVVTYTQPISVISRKLFVALVVDNKKKILTFFAPMVPSVYACLFGSMVVMAIFLTLMDKAVHVLMPGKYVDPPESFGSSTWYILSAVLQQGCMSSPSALSPRVVFWFWFIISVLVFTAYSATLMSQLAVVRPVTLPFSNLFELSKLSGWQAGCVKDDLFQVTASQTCAVEPRSDECQTLYDVWNKNVMKSPENLIPNYIAGLQRTLKGEYVFIGVGVTTRYFIGQLPMGQACKIRELPGKYIQGGIAIGLQHRSPFQPSFDKSLQKMKELGLVEKLSKIWLKRDGICENTDVLMSADLIDVSSLFVLLLFGIASSLIVFVGEIVKRRNKGLKRLVPPETEDTKVTPFDYEGRGFTNDLEKR